MGSSISYNLARAGFRTLTLERFGLNHANGSSHGKTRIIRTAYFEDPVYVPLVKRARELWFELQRMSGNEIIRMTGSLEVGPSGGTLVSGALRSAREHGLEHRIMTPAEIRDEFEVFRPGEGQVGFFEKDAGVLFSERCIESYVSLAQAAGGEFLFGHTVKGWRESGGEVVVSTADEAFAASFVALAAGPWMPSLVPDLALPLVCERQVLFWLKAGEDVAPPGRATPVFGFEEGDGIFYGIPSVEDGWKVARHHGGEIARRPEELRKEVDERDELPVKGFVGRRLPSLAGAFSSSAMCIYTNAPDYKFVIDFHPRTKRVAIVSPCSGHGFKFASAVGEVVSQMATGEMPRYDISAFGIGRFDGAAISPGVR